MEKEPRLRKKYSRPPATGDILYRSDVVHKDSLRSCDEACGETPDHLVTRSQRGEDDNDPAIHYGLIASSNQILKDAQIRDQLAAEKGVLCFEMEAAGLMDHFPCLVIRGICDYADSHKNNIWQGYAAMVAAAYAKELLQQIPPSKVEAEPPIAEALGADYYPLDRPEQTTSATQATVGYIKSSHHTDKIERWLRPPDPSTNVNHARKLRHEGTGAWLLAHPVFQSWTSGSRRYLWLHGFAGSGKTVLSTTVLDHVAADNDRLLISFFFDFSDTTKQSVDGMLRSLAFQLYQCGAGSSVLEASFQAHQDGLRQPATKTLEDIVSKILAVQKKVFIVLDALDESTTRRDLLSWIKDITSRPGLGHVQLICTSRPEAEFLREIPATIGEGNHMRLDKQAVDADIRSYVAAQLTHRRDFQDKGLSQDLMERIQSKVGDGADGMFLWAFYQLEDLARCHNMKGIEEALACLPRDLDELYRQMPQSNSAHLEHDAQRLIFLSPPTLSGTSDPSAQSRFTWPKKQASTKPSSVISNTNEGIDMVVIVSGVPVVSKPDEEHDPQSACEEIEDTISLVTQDDDRESVSEPTPIVVSRRQAATAVLVKTFVQDEDLYGLYEFAFNELDHERFVDNHRKLLWTFVKDLIQQKAVGHSQHEAIKFLTGRQTRMMISSSILDRFKSRVETDLDQLECEARGPPHMLDRFLMLMKTEPAEPPEGERDIDSNSEESDAEDQDSQQVFENTAGVFEEARIFLCTGPAFQEYKRNLRQMLHPGGKPADPSIPVSAEAQLQGPDASVASPQISAGECRYAFSRPFWEVTQDSYKLWVESIAGTRLSWWPLSQPERELRKGFTRIYSEPEKGLPRFYDDLETTFAESLFPGLAQRRKSIRFASPASWTASGFEAVYLKQVSVPEIVQNARAAESQPLSTINEETDQVPGTSGEGSGLQPRVAVTAQTLGRNDSGSAPIVFLTEKIDSRIATAVAVHLGKDDQETMHNLRAAWLGLSGSRWKRVNDMYFYQILVQRLSHGSRTQAPHRTLA
ncbi:hypothetical protein B0T11DRAFT_27623 [Plectosphaerella cucumerina]|uniref:NACHT domain-containing protein n=1 Tax=Plectosphaerella cucumerina TaxID=40658 RepID=A0A8K0TU56_9PEZI|nr:hypothetical protein B0T11DRAFT_27623 [Plectosphaerella cucumerina]